MNDADMNTLSEDLKPSIISINIHDLPVELLILLLSYLDIKTLGRLAKVSRTFRTLVLQDVVWLQRTSFFMVHGGSCSTKSMGGLSLNNLYEKCRISHNWLTGTFYGEKVIHYQNKEIPCVRITNDSLLSSRGFSIDQFSRTKNSPAARRNTSRPTKSPDVVFRGFGDDVTRFVIKDADADGVLVSGCRDGSLASWLLEDSLGKYSSVEKRAETSGKKNRRHKQTQKSVVQRFPLIHVKDAHSSDVNCVDKSGALVLSGSRDGSIKIWSHEVLENKTSFQMVNSLQMGDRVWSLAASPDGTFFACGSAGCNGVPALHLWSLSEPSMGSVLGVLRNEKENRNGAGILDVQFQSSQLLVSAGYDSCVRVWDLRTLSCVAEMEDPHDSAIYCISIDESQMENYGGGFVVLSGTARHGVINLWDRRKTQQPFRMIYSGFGARGSSPVYSMATDSRHIYSAIDTGVSLIDFSIFRTRNHCTNKQSYAY